MASSFHFLTALSLLLLLLPHAHAASYVVGDSTGWTIPPTPTTYSSWAARHTFRIGDTLVFNFPTGIHDVAHVDKRAYDSCTSTNANLSTVGPATLPLNSPGTNYFICTFASHCSLGQKLSVNVLGASAPAPSSPPTPPPSTAPKPPTPTPTPSPPTPSPSMSPSSPPTTSTPTSSPPAPSMSPSSPPTPSMMGPTPSPSEGPTSGSPPPSTGLAPGSSASPGGGAGAGGPGSSPSPTADQGPPRNSAHGVVTGGWVVVAATMLWCAVV